MAPKRKNEDDSASTGREKKRLKNDIARTIALQPSASSSNGAPMVAGQSNGMQGLPSTIDVEKFAEARAFEIKSMQDAMKNSSAAGTQRVWQTLPRHLRRRAASHDVRRVPARLRDKARQEMDLPKKGKHILPKRGKNNRKSRTDEMLSRQQDKTWLETHIWHAKRMHMENMWGYRLAVSPTEKAFRPSHRAAVHGSILHDASYHSLIELKGPESMLRAILDRCSDPQGVGPGARRYLTGSRMVKTTFYNPDAYPFDLIGPVSVLWCPLNSMPSPLEPRLRGPTADEAPIANDPHPKRKRSKKGKEKAADTSESDPDAVRIVWVFVHPTITSETTVVLQSAASAALSTWKDRHPSAPPIEVEIGDITGEINIFEMFGPKSSQVVQGALTPLTDKRPEFNQFWRSLKDLQSAGSVPRGLAAGFTVFDPRLNFPPKNAKVVAPQADLSSSNPGAPSFPSAILAKSEMWDGQKRAALKKPRYKKSELDDRRSKTSLIPGTPLPALQHDDRVPVLLVQHSLEWHDRAGSASNGPAIHGWLVIIPAGWAMPFFCSLVHTGTRVAGQRERATQTFEAGLPYFPRDFPTTVAYASATEQEAQVLKDKWERKPPAKRPNWEALGTKSPYKPDWEVVLGLRQADLADGLVNAQRQPDAETVKPWLLRGCELPTIMDKVVAAPDEEAALRDIMTALQAKRVMLKGNGQPNTRDVDVTIISGRPQGGLIRGALVRVRVTPCLRGAPQDIAVIYELETDEEAAWRSTIESQVGIADGSEGGEAELDGLSQWTPSNSPDVIGYITTGSYSLSRGKGTAIGMVPFAWYVQALRRARSGASVLRIIAKVRDRDGTICRAVYIDMLEE